MDCSQIPSWCGFLVGCRVPTRPWRIWCGDVFSEAPKLRNPVRWLAPRSGSCPGSCPDVSWPKWRQPVPTFLHEGSSLIPDILRDNFHNQPKRWNISVNWPLISRISSFIFSSILWDLHVFIYLHPRRHRERLDGTIAQDPWMDYRLGNNFRWLFRSSFKIAWLHASVKLHCNQSSLSNLLSLGRISLKIRSFELGLLTLDFSRYIAEPCRRNLTILVIFEWITSE